MAKMEWKYTGGFDPREFATVLSLEDDYELKDTEKDLFVAFDCSEASKTLLLGLADGQHMFVTNIGDTNAVTVANLEDDTGTSLAKGETALVIGSTTADATVILVLNASGD